jgi:ABC transporter DrrB family efflux protein
MTAITMPTPGRLSAATRMRWVVTDSLAMARRNLLRYTRLPELLFFSTVQPVMFVVLFNYVFGGAVGQAAGGNYTDYLLPGIFIQTVLFGSMSTGMGLAEDLASGMIDRYRSLPMARPAVVAGRIMADTVRNSFVVLLMIAVGYLIGFRFHGGPVDAFLVLVMAVVFGIPFSWISAVIGVSVRDVETVQTAGFFWVFPFVFISSAFVPVQTMPGWLRAIADANPVSHTVDAVRALSLGTPVGDSVWLALVWIAALTLIAAPIAVSRYRRV